MRNIKLTISYDGRCFSGWQTQENANSVQAEIEKAFKRALKEKVRIIGAGRTDSGVHALGQVANFKTSLSLPAERIMAAVNRSLCPDIRILKAEEVDLDFHAQFDAVSKTYRYIIYEGKVLLPQLKGLVWPVKFSLNLALMRNAAGMLKGRHDFSSFRAGKQKTGSSIRTMHDIRISTLRKFINLSLPEKSRFIVISLKADGFLHHMVRNIVGTIVDVGRGFIKVQDVEKILILKSRCLAGPTAPAGGLYLNNVTY